MILSGLHKSTRNTSHLFEQGPALVGLAKKEETVVFPDGRPPLNLPLNHPGLQLLQRLRDEAHRFANTYNADLRSRRIRESVLDDLPGLGPARKRALLEHFGTIDGMRRAGVAEILEVPGFGPGLAPIARVSRGGRVNPFPGCKGPRAEPDSGKTFPARPMRPFSTSGSACASRRVRARRGRRQPRAPVHGPCGASEGQPVPVWGRAARTSA